MSFLRSSFYTKTVTATDDLPFSLEDDWNVVLESCNIHCLTNDAYYGNPLVQSAPLRANAVIWFDSPVRVSDICFKNYTAGSNCVIVIAGVLKEGL